METKDRLLIVDGDKTSAESIKQNIELRETECFEAVFIASTADQAERLLKTEKITVLLCDYKPSIHQPKIAAQAVDWRRRFSSIQNVFIYSEGDLSEIPKIKGIDAIFSKSTFTQNTRL